MEREKKVELIISDKSINDLSRELGIENTTLKEELAKRIAKYIDVHQLRDFISGNEDRRLFVFHKTPKWTYMVTGRILAIVFEMEHSIVVYEVPEEVNQELDKLSAMDVNGVLYGDPDALFCLEPYIHNMEETLAARLSTAE